MKHNYFNLKFPLYLRMVIANFKHTRLKKKKKNLYTSFVSDDTYISI